MRRSVYLSVDQITGQFCQICGHRVYDESICYKCRSAEKAVERISLRIRDIKIEREYGKNTEL